MTNTPAADCLQARFDQVIETHRRGFGFVRHDPQWHGPSAVRPMIEFLSVMDAGEPMSVTPADYHDPERWWL